MPPPTVPDFLAKPVDPDMLRVVVARALVPIHCGAVPADLLESELFGHLKGSFTGATADRSGLIETAHGGTLFLGEMPPAMQVKLLRFLSDGNYQPVGARAPREADAGQHRHGYDLDAGTDADRRRKQAFEAAVLARAPKTDKAAF